MVRSDKIWYCETGVTKSGIYVDGKKEFTNSASTTFPLELASFHFAQRVGYYFFNGNNDIRSDNHPDASGPRRKATVKSQRRIARKQGNDDKHDYPTGK